MVLRHGWVSRMVGCGDGIFDFTHSIHSFPFLKIFGTFWSPGNEMDWTGVEGEKIYFGRMEFFFPRETEI